jgi:hypothetical protein
MNTAAMQDYIFVVTFRGGHTETITLRADGWRAAIAAARARGEAMGTGRPVQSVQDITPVWQNAAAN